MPEANLYDINKQKVGTVQLSQDIFGAKVNAHLVQQYVDYQQARSRRGTAATIQAKRDLRGSGKKPWRQKGTGRARAGTSRSPVWRGGLTVFGPSPRDFSFKLSKRNKVQALCSVLTERLQTERLVVVDQVVIDAPKTKSALAFMRKMELPEKTLFLVAEKNKNLELAVRNLPWTDVLPVAGLNAFDLLAHEKIVVTRDALQKIEERLSR